MSPTYRGYSVEQPIPSLVNNLRSHCIQRVALGAQNNLVCLTGVANEVFEWRFSEDNETGEEAQLQPQLNKQLRGKRLQSIAVGKSHYACVTHAGKMIVWCLTFFTSIGLY
jgi:hypothetical protein